MSSNLHNWETAPYWPWQKIGSLFWRIKKRGSGTFLVVEWLRLLALTAMILGLSSDWGTKLQAMWHSKKKKKFQEIQYG